MFSYTLRQAAPGDVYTAKLIIAYIIVSITRPACENLLYDAQMRTAIAFGPTGCPELCRPPVLF
jgi:hypothetical protein